MKTTMICPRPTCRVLHLPVWKAVRVRNLTILQLHQNQNQENPSASWLVRLALRHPASWLLLVLDPLGPLALAAMELLRNALHPDLVVSNSFPPEVVLPFCTNMFNY